MNYELFTLKYIMLLLDVLAKHLAPIGKSHLTEKSKWEFLGFGGDSILSE